MKKELMDYLLGDIQPIAFIGNYIYALAAVVLRMLWGVARRDPHDQRTPFKFSFGFFIRDNAARIVGTLIAIAIIITMSNKIFGIVPTAYMSLVIGLFIVPIVDRIMKFKPEWLTAFLYGKTKETMEQFEWYLQFESVNDRASLDGEGFMPIDDFVSNTSGTLVPSVPEAVYSSQPAFTSVTFRRQDNTTYIAGPIRRPK